ncbi:dihydroxyacetone kinase family protein [Arthrobacter bambusae]|uniref:dihydroxyacetone kinase family protein n=1 Tax=Arthrobacter bambusae TaxID=1338426 RepID=UPI0027846543|nr:dihydroxyacetone kinase family protein [Arthrobacter bambusae]MDQ0211902.1 dihydroxyacetone kinase [Arthrobacter bambusae]MDQ0236468.1 dihydroxyacetone kinase [Arthrobacter bambusae]
MTVLFNDPSEFAEDQFSGFLDLYSDRLRGVPGGAVAHRSETPQVAVVVGGGSGHYPAFCGIVGPGFATGAVVGNIFTSPSAAQVYSVAKAADQGKGVILTFGNYAGDNMNFGIAAERLRKEGIDTRIVVVTDDIASSPIESERRGIAGDFTVFKALGAAAAAGLDLDEVERVGRAANAATRSFGVAFSGCTMPGADAPLFTVPENHMGVGLGIHGEPGIRDEVLGTAEELATLLVRDLLNQAPARASSRVAVILNGLGTTKYEELFLVWNSVAPLLREAGLEIVEPEVGELVTSLDMGGISLTLMWLDKELEWLWSAETYTPAYRKQKSPLRGLRPAVRHIDEAEELDSIPVPSPAAVPVATLVLDGLRVLASTMHANETELGRIDAVAGDGDHGRGMVKGADAALASAERAARAAAGPSYILRKAGQAWAAAAGGTSGVLWGAGLESAAAAIDDQGTSFDRGVIATAVHAFSTAITDLGRAKPGDKTIVDAMLPFVDGLELALMSGKDPAVAWASAATEASAAAAATASLAPKLGRARPLAEKSIGTPDAGATSFGMIVTALQALTRVSERTQS